MQRRRVLLGVGIMGALAAGAAGIGQAASTQATIVAKGRVTFQTNRFVHSTQHFNPGRATVASGGTVTLRNEDGAGEPHTFTLVDFGSDLPQSADEVFNCEVCNEIGAQQFPDNAEPVPVLDTGKKGFDQRGDSYLLFPGQSATVPVAAPAGTNLFFMCIIHPWMQGRINVR